MLKDNRVDKVREDLTIFRIGIQENVGLHRQSRGDLVHGRSCREGDDGTAAIHKVAQLVGVGDFTPHQW